MTVLHVLSYGAGTAAFLFVLLSLASGLLYIAEVIEEHANVAKVIGQRVIYAVMLLILVLHYTDDIPWRITALCLFAHMVYLQNFSRTWPAISLLSPAFLLSCILVVATHFVAFSYFSERAHAPRRHRSRPGHAWSSQPEESFLDVATFFGICIWLVPFYLFLSLSANDNILPAAGEGEKDSADSPLVDAPTPIPGRSPVFGHTRKQSSILKKGLTSALSLVLRPRTAASLHEGLISPTFSRPHRAPASPSAYPSSQLWSTSPPSPPRSPAAYTSHNSQQGYFATSTPGSGSGSPSATSAFAAAQRPLAPRRSATEGVLPDRPLVPNLSASLGAGSGPSPSMLGNRGVPLRRPSAEPLRLAQPGSSTATPPPPPLVNLGGSVGLSGYGSSARVATPTSATGPSPAWDGRASAPASASPWSDVRAAGFQGAEGMTKRKVG